MATETRRYFGCQIYAPDGREVTVTIQPFNQASRGIVTVRKGGEMEVIINRTFNSRPNLHALIFLASQYDGPGAKELQERARIRLPKKQQTA
ncbi:MAG: hypothetical protein WC686_04605 [Candidatus Shapirobacteria bacterium]|jgi:hypothetical protein